jgi:hypothetical protein
MSLPPPRTSGQSIARCGRIARNRQKVNTHQSGFNSTHLVASPRALDLESPMARKAADLQKARNVA